MRTNPAIHEIGRFYASDIPIFRILYATSLPIVYIQNVERSVARYHGKIARIGRAEAAYIPYSVTLPDYRTPCWNCQDDFADVSKMNKCVSETKL